MYLDVKFFSAKCSCAFWLEIRNFLGHSACIKIDGFLTNCNCKSIIFNINTNENTKCQWRVSMMLFDSLRWENCFEFIIRFLTYALHSLCLNTVLLFSFVGQRWSSKLLCSTKTFSCFIIDRKLIQQAINVIMVNFRVCLHLLWTIRYVANTENKHTHTTEQMNSSR